MQLESGPHWKWAMCTWLGLQKSALRDPSVATCSWMLDCSHYEPVFSTRFRFKHSAFCRPLCEQRPRWANRCRTRGRGIRSALSERLLRVSISLSPSLHPSFSGSLSLSLSHSCASISAGLCSVTCRGLECTLLWVSCLLCFWLNNEFGFWFDRLNNPVHLERHRIHRNTPTDHVRGNAKFKVSSYCFEVYMWNMFRLPAI